MYDRDFYRQSQFEPASAVNGGMRVSSPGAAVEYSLQYDQAPASAYSEAAESRCAPAYREICFPAEWLEDGAPTPPAEPPPYGGSLHLAPAMCRRIHRPYRLPTIEVTSRETQDPDHPIPEPEPQPKPSPAAEHKPFHPYITTTPPTLGREGEDYTYQAKAHDGIATGFRWSLDGAPPGMRVDPDSGKLTWTPGRGGWYSIRLTAFSLYGKQAVQTWTILVKKAVKVHVHRPNPRYRAALAVRAEARSTRPQPDIPRIPPPPLRVWRLSSTPVAALAAPTSSPPRRRPARVTPARAPRLHDAGHLL